MNAAAADAAWAAALILAPELGAGLPADVEAALHARDAGDSGQRRADQYLDPIALGTLIVAIATLAWSIYADQRKRTEHPDKEIIARQARLTLRQQGDSTPPETGKIIEIVVTEVIRACQDD